MPPATVHQPLTYPLQDSLDWARRVVHLYGHHLTAEQLPDGPGREVVRLFEGDPP